MYLIFVLVSFSAFMVNKRIYITMTRNALSIEVVPW